MKISVPPQTGCWPLPGHLYENILAPLLHIREIHKQTTWQRAGKNSFPRKAHAVSSAIWNWFRFKASDAEQTTPRCKVCLNLDASKGSSTTNLLQHLKPMHAAEWKRCCALRNEQDHGSTSTPTKNNLQSLIFNVVECFVCTLSEWPPIY